MKVHIDSKGVVSPVLSDKEKARLGPEVAGNVGRLRLKPDQYDPGISNEVLVRYFEGKARQQSGEVRLRNIMAYNRCRAPVFGVKIPLR